MDKSGPSQNETRTTQRTCTGCLTCRKRRCDEVKPICRACNRLGRECQWPDATRPPVRRPPRRPNATACKPCRTRKLKCEGDPRRGQCTRCYIKQISCDWNESVTAQNVSSSNINVGSSNTADSLHNMIKEPNVSGTEMESLVNRYFTTVHHHGFMTFVHEGRFRELLAAGKAPKDLTMAMVAAVLRFACQPTHANISKSDFLVDSLIASLVPRVLHGFGVLQLMALIQVAHCETHRSRFSSHWLLTSLCVRMMQMMQLLTFDVKYPLDKEITLSPLLSREVLRRVAWSTFYLDSMVDGGRYGYQSVNCDAFRIQLPSREESFLRNEAVRTETLYRDTIEPLSNNLGLSALLIRAAAMRRTALHVVFRISQRDWPSSTAEHELRALELDITRFFETLPAQYYFNPSNTFCHRSRLPAFTTFHLLRHNLYVILGRAKLALWKDDNRYSDLVLGVRRDRISHALPISDIIEEALKYDVPLDPHVGIQAYVALEILLFEPRRLSERDSTVNPLSSVFIRGIPPLLAAVRELGRRSGLIKTLHVEAVHRLLRCEMSTLLNDFDLEIFGQEYQVVGQDEEEFDFRDFRWAKLERQERASRPPAGAAGDATLLESRSEEFGPAVQLKSSSASNAQQVIGNVAGVSQVSFPGAQNVLSPVLGAADQLDQVDFSWLLSEAGTFAEQTGDPAEFWKQLGV